MCCVGLSAFRTETILRFSPIAAADWRRGVYEPSVRLHFADLFINRLEGTPNNNASFISVAQDRLRGRAVRRVAEQKNSRSATRVSIFSAGYGLAFIQFKLFHAR